MAECGGCAEFVDPEVHLGGRCAGLVGLAVLEYGGCAECGDQAVHVSGSCGGLEDRAVLEGGRGTVPVGQSGRLGDGCTELVGRAAGGGDRSSKHAAAKAKARTKATERMEARDVALAEELELPLAVNAAASEQALLEQQKADMRSLGKDMEEMARCHGKAVCPERGVFPGMHRGANAFLRLEVADREWLCDFCPAVRSPWPAPQAAAARSTARTAR